MKKRWRLTGLISAVILGLGGIGVGVYAVYALQTLTRSIDQSITYTPGLLEAFSAKYYVNGIEEQTVDFDQDNGKQATPGEITFTGGGFIVYEFSFKMNAKYDSIICSIYLTTNSEGLKVGSGGVPGAGSDVSYSLSQANLINTISADKKNSSKTCSIYIELDETKLAAGARLSYNISAVFTEGGTPA